jgi:hypothetical protein
MADTTNANTTDASTTNPSPTGAPDPAGPGRRYRARGSTARERRVTPRFTDAELSAIQAAADAAQMTVTGFCALAALALARREPGQPDRTGGTRDGSGLAVEELAEMQRELFAARTAVNRTGVNLNQAVAALNSTGRAPVWLEHAVQRVTRAVGRVDAVAAELHRRLA